MRDCDWIWCVHDIEYFHLLEEEQKKRIARKWEQSHNSDDLQFQPARIQHFTHASCVYSIRSA